MEKKYITQNRLKKNTLADIFIFILEKKQTTRREIEYETGFSWGTVSANVAFLIEKGYIQEEKSEQSGTAGRTTYLLKPASTGFVSIGLDINRSGLSCELVTLNSVTVKKFQTEFCAATQAEVIGQAEALLRTAIDWCDENAFRVFSLGIAMQGSLNGRLGISMHFPGISDWRAYPIKEHFAKKYRFPVYLGHDPKCMLLGALSRQRQDDCVLVRIDDGIGMAVSYDGRILDDTEKLELGHTLVAPGGRACNCGKCGCLEAYATLPSIAQAGTTDDLLQAPDRFRTSILEAGSYLSVALYNIYILFKPQRLILTGKAALLSPFTDCALARLRNEELEITVDPELSAAYGAAVESMRSAIQAFTIGKETIV